jgi:hypothetical protein
VAGGGGVVVVVVVVVVVLVVVVVVLVVDVLGGATARPTCRPIIVVGFTFVPGGMLCEMTSPALASPEGTLT